MLVRHQLIVAAGAEQESLPRDPLAEERLEPPPLPFGLGRRRRRHRVCAEADSLGVGLFAGVDEGGWEVSAADEGGALVGG